MTINVTSEKIVKWLQPLLLVAIFGLLIWSKPWDSTSKSVTRKITVKGDTTIKATPDEYVFSPYFEQLGKDKEALKASLTKKANDAVAKLKELGVAEKDIKVDASSYDYWYSMYPSKGTPMTVSLQVTVTDKELAQKVQDYFLTLDLEGQLTPTASFSEAKQKELDAQAVDEASKDARKKAEAQASLLGVKLGKVLEVSQGSDSVFPVYDMSVSSGSAEINKDSSLQVLPGQNEYTQSVTVTYELK